MAKAPTISPAKEYANAEGHYLGSYVEGTQPEGSQEVPGEPASLNQTWNGTAWADPA